MDPKRYGSRKFIATTIGLVGYLVYCFVTPGYHVDAIGVATIIGAYGLVNAYQGKGDKGGN